MKMTYKKASKRADRIIKLCEKAHKKAAKSKLVFKKGVEKHCVNCLHLDELELNCTVKLCKFKGTHDDK